MPPMLVVLDQFGFPYVRLAGGGAIGLFPVWKVQVEMLLGQPSGPSWLDYKPCLEQCPRVSWRHAPRLAKLDGLWLMGVLPEEAMILGERAGGRRLPQAAEWREADQTLERACHPEAVAKLQKFKGLHPAVASLLGRATPPLWRDYSAGYLEWVQTPQAFGLYGDPRPDFGLNWLNNRFQTVPMIPRSPQRHRAYTFRWYWDGRTETLDL